VKPAACPSAAKNRRSHCRRKRQQRAAGGRSQVSKLSGGQRRGRKHAVGLAAPQAFQAQGRASGRRPTMARRRVAHRPGDARAGKAPRPEKSTGNPQGTEVGPPGRRPTDDSNPGPRSRPRPVKRRLEKLDTPAPSNKVVGRGRGSTGRRKSRYLPGRATAAVRVRQVGEAGPAQRQRHGQETARPAAMLKVDGRLHQPPARQRGRRSVGPGAPSGTGATERRCACRSLVCWW